MEIALIGNPNTGKSSLFNLLTGLNQKVGNFPGITVEQKKGVLKIDNIQHTITDYPGVYSIYPKSADEKIVYESLISSAKSFTTDLCLFVMDASNLERNLFLFSQLYDLGLPIICVLNMVDIARRKGIDIDKEKLEQIFPGVVFVEINARIGLGKDRLISAIEELPKTHFYKKLINPFVPLGLDISEKHEKEATERYDAIKKRIQNLDFSSKSIDHKQNKLDKILTHRIWGYVIFLIMMLLIFQFIFSFAQFPMELIDFGFVQLSNIFSENFPPGIINDLISNGVIPGLGGVFIFVPQIIFLFFFIKILEDTGYLSRVVFIMDRIMRPLGLNGKSVVPLISSFACAIPGIMAARTISNWKDRIITIFIAPLMSCSARIPVYTLLISLIIPKYQFFGIIELQGLVMFGLYFLGIIAAILIAFLMKTLIKTKSLGTVIFELPGFKMPRWKNIAVEVLQKAKVFIVEAGKIILALSVILWALSTYGPNEAIENEIDSFQNSDAYVNMTEDEKKGEESKIRLENSYIGIFGKAIEPSIEPLGYDWKIGISLITSFAAREVFVGSLATIYASNEEDESRTSLKEKLSKEKKSNGELLFSFASGMSLLIFYVFAMQCMATFSIVRRETQSWKWPILQLFIFSSLAYIFSAFTFFFLS